MLNRRDALQLIPGAFLAMAALATGRPARAADPLPVVASFSILGDMVQQVGGARVSVTTLVGPDADAHVFQPTPADARALVAARAMFVNGLGFEGWMDRLVAAAGFRGPVIVASVDVKPLVVAGEDEEEGHDHGHEHAHVHGHDHGHDHGDVDPHAWQSLVNGALYVETIARSLIAADPDGTADYRANADRYLAAIRALDRDTRAAIAALPADRRLVVTSHDAFNYFAAEYGIRFVAPEGVSTESEASARDVARLIEQIRAEHIPAVFIENITDPRLIEQIRRETGAVIGGTLYSDALSPAGGPAATYLDMFRHNVATLTRALSS